VTSTLFSKSGEAEMTSQPSSIADQYEAKVNIRHSRQVGNDFQYLPPPPSLTQLVRPVSAPPVAESQRTPNLSEISLDQLQCDQLKKRPSTSRGYRNVDRGPYNRSISSGIKQAIVNPLVSSNSNNKTVTTTSSGKFDPGTDTEEDLDDDTMPLEEADTVLTSGTEIVTPPSSMATLEGPSTSSRVQPQRQTGLVLSLKPSSSRRRSSSSEKKVNFSLTLGPGELPEIPEIAEQAMTEPHVNTMVSNIIQIAKEQCEADLVPDQAVSTPTDDEVDTLSVDNAQEEVTNTNYDKGGHPSTLTTNKQGNVVNTQGTINDAVIPQISSEVLDGPIATSQRVIKKFSKLSTDSKASMTKKGSKLDTQKSASSSKKSGKKNAVQPSKKKLDPQWKQAILKNVKK